MPPLLPKYAITQCQPNGKSDFCWSSLTTYGQWVADLETTYPDMSVKGVAIQMDGRRQRSSR